MRKADSQTKQEKYFGGVLSSRREEACGIGVSLKLVAMFCDFDNKGECTRD